MRIEANPGLKRIMEQPYAFDVVELNREKAEKKFGKDYIIDFGVGDPTDEAPEAIRERCKKAVDERRESGYPVSIGHQEFRAAVCRWMKRRFGVSLENSEVVATYGAKYACFHLPLYFTNPKRGDIVLIPNPGYPPYTEGTMLANAEPYYMNLFEENGFEPSLDEIDRGVAGRAKMFFLNFPHSPTGRVYSDEKLKEVVDFCTDNEIILVSDECYSELYFGKAPKSILNIRGSEECSIVLNSLSKRSMMTGYAAGFFASKNMDLLKPFKAAQQKSVQGVATFIQDAAVAAYSDEAHTEKMRVEYGKRMDAFIPALRQAGCKAEKPDGTFYIWAKLPEKVEPLEFSEKMLMEKGINCTPGTLVSKEFKGENPGIRYVRFAMVQKLQRTKEAAERLLKP